MAYRDIKRSRFWAMLCVLGGVLVIALAVIAWVFSERIIAPILQSVLLETVAAAYREGGVPAQVKKRLEHRYLEFRNPSEGGQVLDLGGKIEIEIVTVASSPGVFIGVYDSNATAGKFVYGYGPEWFGFFKPVSRNAGLANFLSLIPRVTLIRLQGGHRVAVLVPSDILALNQEASEQLHKVRFSVLMALGVCFVCGTVLSSIGVDWLWRLHVVFTKERRVGHSFSLFNETHGRWPQVRSSFVQFCFSRDLTSLARKIQEAVLAEDRELNIKAGLQRRHQEVDLLLKTIARGFRVDSPEWDEITTTLNNSPTLEQKEALAARMERVLRRKQEGRLRQIERH